MATGAGLTAIDGLGVSGNVGKFIDLRPGDTGNFVTAGGGAGLDTGISVGDSYYKSYF